jgi:hypothetical protein
MEGQQDLPPFSQMVGDRCQWMRRCSLATRALYWALGIKQASGNTVFRGLTIIANMLVSVLGIGTPQGSVEIFASWSGTRWRGWGLSREVDFWTAQKILQERIVQ